MELPATQVAPAAQARQVLPALPVQVAQEAVPAVEQALGEPVGAERAVGAAVVVGFSTPPCLYPAMSVWASGIGPLAHCF